MGVALSLGLAQSASAVTFKTDWTGQISGYRAEGAFSYDEGQTYTNGIVRRDDLTDFDISFYDPTGSLLKTFEDNHLTYDGFNFNFDTRTQEILQDGYFDEPNGIDIGEYISLSGDPGKSLEATGLNFWSAAPAPDGEPIPHVHLTDFGSEFPGPPIEFGPHLDVAFFTRTRAQLLDDPSAGDQFGEKMSATKVPEPGLLLGMGVIFLWKGFANALLLTRLRRAHVVPRES
ncbi:MAG: PEP-CTERM sorting domain-containing protein [Cyanobacteria bacterium J06649_5]